MPGTWNFSSSLQNSWYYSSSQAANTEQVLWRNGKLPSRVQPVHSKLLERIVALSTGTCRRISVRTSTRSFDRVSSAQYGLCMGSSRSLSSIRHRWSWYHIEHIVFNLWTPGYRWFTSYLTGQDWVWRWIVASPPQCPWDMECLEAQYRTLSTS